jgi:hypothetical protein
VDAWRRSIKSIQLIADPNDENRETLQKAKVGARARTTQGTDGRNVDLSHSLGIVLLIFSKTIDG